jgi:hypothetical protein
MRSGNFRYSGTGLRTINSANRFGGTAVRSTSFNQSRMVHRSLTRPTAGGIASVERNHGQNHQGLRNQRVNRAGNAANANRNNRALANNNRHVFARHATNQHPHWDKHHDHWWNGHHCHWAGNSWIIFDIGFSPFYGYPWDYYGSNYYYPYGYPYNYGYGYDDGGGYDSNVYEGSQVAPAPDYSGDDGKDYYYDSSNQGFNQGADQGSDSTVVAAQQRLSRQGYYHGEIDGVLGPETRRAIVRFQSNNGLRVTGSLTPETLQSLGRQRVAGY